MRERREYWLTLFSLIAFGLLLIWIAVRDPARQITPGMAEIRASESGGSYEYPRGSMFRITLDQTEYPINRFETVCSPAGVLERLSNIPGGQPPFYSARFGTVQSGNCTIRNGQLMIHVRIK